MCLFQAVTTGRLAPSPVEEQAPPFPQSVTTSLPVAMVQPPTPVAKVVPAQVIPEGDSSSRLASPCGDDKQPPLSCSLVPSSTAVAANATAAAATPPSSSVASALPTHVSRGHTDQGGWFLPQQTESCSRKIQTFTPDTARMLNNYRIFRIVSRTFV